MYITATQFALLVEEIQDRYSRQGDELDDAEEIRAILLRDYPQVHGVVPPPVYERIRREYLPEDWDMEIPQQREIRPRPGRPVLSSGSPRDRYAPPRPPRDPRLQIQADLDLLRTNPIGAMTYLVHRARGIESDRAMRWAHLSGRLYELMTIAGARHTHRAISGQTGQPGDIHDRRAVSASRADMVMRATPAGPPPGGRPLRRSMRLRPVSSAPSPGYPARSMSMRSAIRPPRHRFLQNIPASQVRAGLREQVRRTAR